MRRAQVRYSVIPTVARNGRVYAVTDNDGVKDDTGETQLLDLGTALR